MNLAQKSHAMMHITHLCYLAILVLMVVTTLPPFLSLTTSIAPVLGVKLLPLLIVLPGLLLNKLRTYIWLCFIILFYFTQAVVESFLSLGANIDLAITLLSVVLFLAAMLHVKWERELGRSL
jgi:uncharacterized membrane protein